MGEILGVGLSHFPGFVYADNEMSARVKQTVTSARVPEHLKDPKNWPPPMQVEWGEDEGTSFATRHREQFVSGVRRLRQAIDDFQPDVVLIFGDDQYENFREEIIPPFCVYILDEVESRPHALGRIGDPTPNIWGEPDDLVMVTKGHPAVGRYLARRLMENDFDMSYAYKLNFHVGLGHAFARTIQYLDYDRTGWNYPVVPFHINAYGSSVIRNRGISGHLFGDKVSDPDPPGPSPRRCFQLGQTIARLLKESPWRVVMIGSSSWSHAFLTAKNYWVYPDVDSDRKRFEDLAAGRYEVFRDLPLAQIEESGQNELLNWIPLIGAMHELGQKPAFCDFMESYLMNSCKCNALFLPESMTV
jgi:hypothetical protein